MLRLINLVPCIPKWVLTKWCGPQWTTPLGQNPFDFVVFLPLFYVP
jgi:hypothetical protein